MLQCDFFVYEYPGYSISEGCPDKPSEAATYRAIFAAFAYLCGEMAVRQSR